ncbi:MAG: sugar ABC transporter permease [Clostridia bacterium]|nr:sugar ABC transporter permease [Clostridia bacterium]
MSVSQPAVSSRRKFARETLEAYMYLAPALVILLAFHIAPAFYALYISFFETNLMRRWNFVGLANYVKLFQDTDFIRSLANTGKYVLGTVPTGMALSLFAAWLLNQKIRGLAVFRTALFLPYVTPVVAISIVWMWIYKEDGSGLLNAILALFGAKGQAWLLDPRWAMFALCLMSVWRHLGYNMVIFLAGLQNISTEYYEAAEIDGARGWTMFTKITWPLLSPTTYFVTMVSVIGSFQVFTQAYVLWPSASGGPLGSTKVVVKYLYDVGWGSFKFGYAAAIGYALFAIIFLLTLVQRNLVGSRVHYQ